MPSFEIKVNDKLGINLAKFPKEVQRTTLKLIGDDVKRYWTREATGTKRHKGEYRNSFSVESTDSQVTVYTDLKWAKYVEEGRGPVEAKDGGVLCFEVNGETIFAKRVSAYEGRHDIPKVINSVEPRIEGLFKKACEMHDK